MREHFILITPENAVKGVTTEKPGLDFYYEQVGCQSIEIVRISRTRAKHVLVVDEEGLLRENPQLNAIASLLAMHVALIGSGHFEVDNERGKDND